MTSGIDVKPAAVRAPSGQPPHVLAAWVGESLQELRAEHLSALSVMVAKLETDSSAWGGEFLTRAIDAMLEAAKQADPGAMRPRGLWQSLTGSHGRRVQEYQLKFDELLASAAKVHAQIDGLGRGYNASTSNVRKLVVELEMVHRAIAADVEEAVDWLGELAGYLGQTGDATNERARALVTAAESSAAELKAVLAVNDVLGNVVVAGRNVLERRVALLDRAKQDMLGFEKSWRPKVGQVVVKAVGGGGVPAGLAAAESIHAELLSRLDATSGDGVALQLEELGLERLVARMLEELG